MTVVGGRSGLDGRARDEVDAAYRARVGQVDQLIVDAQATQTADELITSLDTAVKLCTTPHQRRLLLHSNPVYTIQQTTVLCKLAEDNQNNPNSNNVRNIEIYK